MVNSRDKGRRGEREFAKLFDGVRISEPGRPGPDVRTPPLVLAEALEVFEVKWSNRWRLREWLKQAEREGADAIAFREDRGPWYVLFPASRLQSARERGRRAGKRLLEASGGNLER